MEDSEINDKREIGEFKGITFSEFKKCDVKKELLNNLYNSKIEPSCYWSAEMICSGNYKELWEIIINFYSKHIHIGNPKLVIYLDVRFNNFLEIINNGYINQELRLRNNFNMRKLFCEIICILCESKKGHCYDEIKVKKEDFNLNEMNERFKAPNINFGQICFKKEDPKELFIPINELGYNISEEGKNCIHSCYWIEWIFEYENICKIKKEKCKCERRTFAKVDVKLQMDIVWIIWDLFLNESNKRSNIIQKIVKSALSLFSLKYSNNCHKKRKLLLYFIISIFTQNIILEEDMIKDKNKISLITNKINLIYKQIKQNEHSVNTDYLFTNIKTSNLEKTIAKLEKMNSFNTEFIPRI